MGRLDGKVALVTGGASGMGRATCLRFAGEGAKIVAADIDEAGGAETVAQVGRAGRFLRLDVTSKAEWVGVVDRILADDGRLDVLVNSAGIFQSGTVEDTSEEQWRRMHAVNMDGTFFGCQQAVRAMRQGGGGSIVNLSSVSGLRGDGHTIAYCSSKGAVRLLSKSVAVHCAQQGLNIRCNSVHPGVIDTPLIHNFFASEPDPAAEEERWRNLFPGTFGRPEDVADMILYLASEESAFVTGAEFVIDGGYTAI